MEEASIVRKLSQFLYLAFEMLNCEFPLVI